MKNQTNSSLVGKSLIINHKSSFPIQYQKGYAEFYKLKFKVTPDVLIPRPETELLVDEVLNYCQLTTDNYKIILDVGTGSGNIAISIAKQLPTSDVGTWIVAIDVSEKALKVARQNARLQGVEKSIKFIRSNLLSFLNNQYDIRSYKLLDNLIIVANLPYIPTARIPYLDSSVKDYEPRLALDGEKDGFDLYRKLFTQINKYKLKPTLILGEIDYTHSELALTETNRYFPKAQIQVKKDLAKNPRILKISF